MIKKFFLLVPVLVGGGIGAGVTSFKKPTNKEEAISSTIEQNKEKELVFVSVDINNLQEFKEIYDNLKKFKPQYVGFESDLKGKDICRNFGYLHPEDNWSKGTGWNSYLLGKEKKHQAWRCIFKETN